MCLSGPDGLVSLFQSLTVHKVYIRTNQREVIGPSFEPVALRGFPRNHDYVSFFFL